jgi:hypothetical protein
MLHISDKRLLILGLAFALTVRIGSGHFQVAKSCTGHEMICFCASLSANKLNGVDLLIRIRLASQILQLFSAIEDRPKE